MGTTKSEDGQINLKLDPPVEMGGKENDINREQLFAAGYAACFICALRVVAGERHIRTPEEVVIDSAVSNLPLLLLLRRAKGRDLWAIPPQQRGPWGLRALGFTDLQTSKKELVVRHIGKDATVLYEFKKPVDLMQDF